MGRMNKPEAEAEIEYETVTVKVPKRIMDFLRQNKALDMAPEEYLAYGIVDFVRADIDGGVFSDPKSIANGYRLNPVFKAVTETEIL